MGKKTALQRAAVALFAIVGTAIAAAPAGAKTEDIIAPSTAPYTVTSGWQAGTCNKDVPDTAEQCSVATPSQFYEEAGGHPQVGFTQFIVAHKTGTLGSEEPIGELKKVHVDLPQGLSVNPQATEQCGLSVFKASASGCPAGSQVGESLVTVSVLGMPFAPVGGTTKVPVYNVEPEAGQPALFGLELAGNEVFLKASVDWAGDFHEGFTIDIPELPFSGLLSGGLVLKNRLAFNGRKGDGTFITTPTTCFDWEHEPAVTHIYSTYLQAASKQEMEGSGYTFPASAEPPLESPLPATKKPLDCPGVPYEPSTGLNAGTAETDAPAGAKVEVEVPHIAGGESRESSQTKQAKLALPEGMGLNASAANGLQTCSDEQFGKGTENPVTCPPESKIGTVSIQTPPLLEPITGDVFVGKQLSRDPTSGEEYRIFVDGESPKFGLSVRLVGHVRADPATGQLTTTFGELPQVPFSAFVLKLKGGPTATLTSPMTCGPHTATATMTPWTAQWNGQPDPTPTDEFTLTSAPGGASPCAKTLAERPFAPKFEAHETNTQAGAYTAMNIDVVRDPGNQELKGVDVKLPPGLTAKLAGVRYCPEPAIAAAAANSGVAEAVTPSCAADSLVGSASITSGSGPEPLHIDTGKAFLAGPYHGAPLSLAVITPATAGPFDLGTVVVRVALFLDPKTARVTAVTDPIPHVYGGALLDIRSVSVKVDRPEFSLNGTNCTAAAFEGTLHGGGANPADPASFSTVAATSPFQLSGCEKLGFGPKLSLRAFGGTKRTRKPKLRATLEARPGDANISRAVVTLPKAFILEQANIAHICTRVQFAADACPADSVYGFAEATTPLLDGPLKGPVYLRSNPEHELPDLVTALRGQVDVELTGVTDTTKQGRLRNTFEAVPDVPVSKFVLTVRGGKRGLLVLTRDICRHKQFARVELSGQNGAQLVKKKLKVQRTCKRKKRHHHRGRGHGVG